MRKVPAKTRPVYPKPGEVTDLLDKMKSGRATTADLEKTRRILKRAHVRVDDAPPTR